jgi:hypothetical protein
MRNASKQNEGIRMLEEFVCTSIPRPSVATSSQRAVVTEPAILIRLGKRPRRGMKDPELLNDAELYEATRSAWIIGERRERVEYAFAVSKFKVLEVYRISNWHRKGDSERRYEFEGSRADDIRDRYIGKDVRGYFKPGGRAAFIYVNVP